MYGLAGEGEKDCGLGQLEMRSWQWWDLSSFSGYMVFGWRSGGLGFKEGGGETGKKDMVGVPEVGMCEACKKVVRRPAWQGQRSPWGSGGAGNWRQEPGPVCGTIYTSQQNCWLGLAIFLYSEKNDQQPQIPWEERDHQAGGILCPNLLLKCIASQKSSQTTHEWVLWV